MGAILIMSSYKGFSIISSDSRIVANFKGYIVSMVTSMVSSATWIFLVATFTMPESTSIVVLAPSFNPPILIVPDQVHFVSYLEKEW